MIKAKVLICTFVIVFLSLLFWVYGNYNEKRALCNERGGVLVSSAEGFEEYICIDKQSIIVW